MELLKRTEEHEQFIFHDKQINHIEDLVAILKEASDDDYSKYADTEKNDFANWVEHVLKSKEVAEKLRTSEARVDTIKVLEEAISSRKEVANKSKDDLMSSTPISKPAIVEPLVEKEADLPKPESIPNSEDIPKPEEIGADESKFISEEPNMEPPKPEDITIEIPKIKESNIEPKLGLEENQNLFTKEIEDKHDASVVAPINNTNSSKIQDDTKPENFCEHHPHCGRKEFLIGLAIGLIIGIIGLKLIEAVI